MEKSEIGDLLRREFAAAAGERRKARSSPAEQAARIALRRFQCERMARTHDDLLRDPHTRAAANFFLTDLYGPHDLSERDAHLERALPVIERLMPEHALAGVAEAVALDALSERLDASMAAMLGPEFDEEAYVQAYRRAGTRADRKRQIDHIARLGASLSSLVHLPLVGKALTVMRTPARLAGVGSLQSFLERGFAAFREMPNPEQFVSTIVERERRIMEQIYAGRKKPFDLA